MPTAMVRVRHDIHALLQSLAREERISMQEILSRSLEGYRRARIFERANEAYAALRSNPDSWEQELKERADWDATLMDEIEPE